MYGVVKNMGQAWAYAFKRAVAPGGEIPLAELYEQYGKKYNISEGEEFVKWLQEVKLGKSPNWAVIIDDPAKQSVVETGKDTSNLVSPIIKKEITVMDIVELSVRKARKKLPEINDIRLLKYALQEASGRSGKDSLCNLLRRRIQELELTRNI